MGSNLPTVEVTNRKTPCLNGWPLAGDVCQVPFRIGAGNEDFLWRHADEDFSWSSAVAVVHLALVVARVGIGQIADAQSPVAKGLVADDFVSSGVLKRIVIEFLASTLNLRVRLRHRRNYTAWVRSAQRRAGFTVWWCYESLKALFAELSTSLVHVTTESSRLNLIKTHFAVYSIFIGLQYIPRCSSAWNYCTYKCEQTEWTRSSKHFRKE